MRLRRTPDMHYQIKVTPDDATLTSDAGQDHYYGIYSKHPVDKRLLRVAALILDGGTSDRLVEQEDLTAQVYCTVQESA